MSAENDKRGVFIADAVRQHLFTNGLKKSQLTGVMVAEVAARALDHLDRLAAKRKRLATEEEWLDEMQADPLMVGVDVRKALANAQFYCRNNNRVCTRKMFGNWLQNPINRPILHQGGSANGSKPAVEGAPPGWLVILNRLFPDSVLAKGGTFEIEKETDYNWSRLDLDVRRAIKKEVL